MVEHRLIERMLAVIKVAMVQIQSSGKFEPFFVDTTVDFIRGRGRDVLGEGGTFLLSLPYCTVCGWI